MTKLDLDKVREAVAKPYSYLNVSEIHALQDVARAYLALVSGDKDWREIAPDKLRQTWRACGRAALTAALKGALT